jgi:hypothetical protein
MEFALCKSSDAWNFEVAPSFLENLFVPGIEYASFCCGTLRYAKLTSFIPPPREDSIVKLCFMFAVLLGQYCQLTSPPEKAQDVKQSITDEGNYTERYFSEFLIIRC